jgi:hypothetical protein
MPLAIAILLAPRPLAAAGSADLAQSSSPAAVATADVVSASASVLPEAATTQSAPGCFAIRPGDQFWLISTRGLGCPDGLTPPALRFWQSNGSGGWNDSTLEAFLAASDPAAPTEFYVHGNFESADDSAGRGMVAYERFAARAPADRPMRFVIWSWPTDRGKHPLELTRMHAQRSDVDAYYLGWLIGRMDRRVKIGLIGYSLGARAVTGALHLLGGGQLIGLTVPIDAKAASPIMRASLLAAAEDCDWLSPGRPNGQALDMVEKMLLLNNGCDSVLKRYSHLERCSRAEALGYVGICGPLDSRKIKQLDVCCAIGKEHVWSRYFYNDSLVADMLPYLFLEPTK